MIKCPDISRHSRYDWTMGGVFISFRQGRGSQTHQNELEEGLLDSMHFFIRIGEIFLSLAGFKGQN